MADLSIPNSFTSGTSIVAADMNANFDAIETMVNTTGVPVLQDGAVSATAKIADGVVSVAKLDAKPVCLLDKSSTQSLTGSMAQITSFTTTLNVQGDHDNTANAITIQTDGLYRVTISVRASGLSSTKGLEAAAYKNGAEVFRCSGLTNGGDAVACGSKILSLVSTDAITLYALAEQGSGTVSASSTFLSIEYIGAAS